MTVNLILHGRPYTKKNSQRIVQRGRYCKILPSKNFEDYQERCGWDLVHAKYGIDTPINLQCVYYMPTKHTVDLAGLIQATQDILVHYGVIVDDNSRIVRSLDGCRVMYDKKNPRAEITITEVENGQTE